MGFLSFGKQAALHDFAALAASDAAMQQSPERQQPLFYAMKAMGKLPPRPIFMTDGTNDNGEIEPDAGHTTQEDVRNTNADTDDGVSSAMIMTIGFYKKVISPLLPPACRFVPTCSQYGIQAIKEYGSTKGLILIAWRLLRCSPIGGKGYDPPRWPPVSYTFSSY